MLRITVQDSARMFRIRLEGKLTAPWVSELENCWRTARSTLPGKAVVVDLTDVEHADAAGKYLLAWMHEAGAQLIASGLAMQEMVAEITDRPAERQHHRRRSSPHLRVWWLILLCAVPLAAQPADRGVVRLTMRRAVEIALSPEGNTSIRLADEAVRQAESGTAQARAALLPDVNAWVSHVNQTRNLEAMGIQFQSSIPGVQFPRFVGPFNTFDVRASVRQNIFDFAAIRRYQSAKAAAGGVKLGRTYTADQVSAQVARAYLAAAKTDSDVETAKANVALAQAVLELVQGQKAAGTGTGIEVTRARVQLANEEQRLLVASSARRRAQLQLLRTVGLRLDTQVELDEALAFRPMDLVTLEQAQDKARELRADLTAQRQRELALRLSASATKLERLPSFSGSGDYGSIGTGIGNTLPTRTIGVSMRLPIFDGGRRDARRAESQSKYRQERVRTQDLEEQIELELRVALDALDSAREQVEVSADGLKLADAELASAQRRYKAGVSTSLEVTDAQTRVQRARSNYTEALFAWNLARIDFAEAQGTVEEVIR